MPADPVAAGKKGGRSRSAKKLAACRRNGFQPVKPKPVTEEKPPMTQEAPDAVRREG
jgi:hypothetical protein